MDTNKSIALDPSRLTEISEEFLEQILAWRPDWREFCLMDEPSVSNGADCDLRMRIRSPTKDSRVDVQFWFHGREPSLEFGHGWHVHNRATFFNSHNTSVDFSVLQCLRLIYSSELVVFGEGVGFEKGRGALLMSNRYEIEDELTSSFYTQPLYVKSWDGRLDCELK